MRNLIRAYGWVLMPAVAAHLAAALPEVEVRLYKGRPTVFIDGKPDALPGFCDFGRAAFDRSMRLAYQNHFRVYFIQPAAERWERFWTREAANGKAAPRPGVFDLDEQAAHILNGDPLAYILVRFTPRPPKSWRDLHEREYFIADDGSIGEVPSLASELATDAMSRYVTAVIRYCESRPWASRVIGYANFGIAEGTHAPVNEGWLIDHNPLMLARWRQFMKRKYGSEDAVPFPHDRLRGPVPEVSNLLYWQPRKDNQALRDYLELQRELFLGSLRRSAAAMRGAVKRKVLFLHDALKQTMLGWSNFGFFDYPGHGRGVGWPLAFPDTMAGSGSMDVTSMFDAPGFDGLITPHDYQARGIGGVYEPEGIVDSTVLRGKYFYCEMDTRTYHRTKNEIGLARDDREYAAITWRNLATGWTRGFSSYWMEFGAGWFDPEGIRATMRRQITAIRESVEWPHETVPGIAMILDDTSVLETDGAGNFLNEAVMWEQKMGLARCGVPHNIYLLEDLALDQFPKHRVFYFPNLFKVDAKRLDLLRRKVFRDGSVVVWGPGSGISDGEKISVASASRLT